MLFSRKNAAIVAAFMAPSAYAQTTAQAAQSPASCNSTGIATFNIGALALATNPTVGDLALQVQVNLGSVCTPTVTPGSNAVGYTITQLTGTLGQITTPGQTAQTAGSPVVFLPSGANGDACFYPCATNPSNQLTSAGVVFSQTNGQTTTVYRYFETNAQVYTLNVNSPTNGAGLTQPGFVTQACKSPSPGAAVCDATLSCAAATRGYYTLAGNDQNGIPATFNIGFDPATACTTGAVNSGQSGAGFQITSISGTVSGAPIGGAFTPSAAVCFYPCSGAVLNAQGVSFNTFNFQSGASTAYTITWNVASGQTTPVYRITTGGTTINFSGTVAASCNANQGAFYRGCLPASSTSSVASSSSSAIVSIPSVSVSIPSVSVPTISSSIAASSVIASVTGSASSVAPSVTGSVTVAPGSSSASSVAIVTSAPASSAGSATSGTPASSGSAASSAASVATGPQTSVPTPFVITVRARATRKRQAVQYIAAGGVLTTDPTAAAVFNLANGQLFSNGAIVSTGPVIPAQQPLAGGAQGTLSTVWTSTVGTIAWNNAVFANGAATFCVANNVVNTVFVATPAAGCVAVALTGVAVSAVVPTVPTASAAAGGITINNNFNPTIGVYVTVNLVLGTSTLANGTVITTTGLSSTTSPLYATPSSGAYCLPCHMSAISSACPLSGNVVYATACNACAAYSTAAPVAVTCPTCVPVTLPTAVPTVVPGTAAPVAPVSTGKVVYTGAAAAYGVEAAAVLVAGAALLL